MENITFRKLNSTDIFPMFKVLGKIGIQDIAKALDADKLNAITKGASGEDATRAIGLSVLVGITNTLLTNIPKCENEIYELLSNCSNLTVKQVKELDFATFTEMVIEFIKKEEFADFIKVVSKLFK